VSGLRPALWAIALAGLAAGAGAIALTLGSDHVTDPWVGATLGPLVGWSFIATGIFAWWRRPRERFGPLMVAVGFAWFVGALTGSDVPAVFTAGLWLGSLYVVLCVHLGALVPARAPAGARGAPARGRRATCLASSARCPCCSRRPGRAGLRLPRVRDQDRRRGRGGADPRRGG
jgi:hypothetical protein